jgi:hypothetical protein
VAISGHPVSGGSQGRRRNQNKLIENKHWYSIQLCSLILLRITTWVGLHAIWRALRIASHPLSKFPSLIGRVVDKLGDEF